MTIANSNRIINAVFLGGGTGSSTGARGMKRFAHCIGVLTTCDDGGSSRSITTGMGIIPVGDLRQFLAALAPQEVEENLNWRFSNPPFNNHPFGSIELAGLIQRFGLPKGIEQFQMNHGIDRGTAIPMTPVPLQLELHRGGKDVVIGESELGEACNGKNYFEPDVTPDLRLEPASDAVLSDQACRAIANDSHIIVIGPGKLYTSVAPVLRIARMREALISARERGVPVVYIVNVMTHSGQTDDMTASRHVQALEDLLGMKILTDVIVNTELPNDAMIAQYAGAGDKPVQVDRDQLDGQHFNVIYDDVLSREFREQNPADLLVRTVLRHDSEVLADLLMGIYLKAKHDARRSK